MHFEAATRIECIGTDRAGELDSCAESSWQPGSAGGGSFVRLKSSFFVVVDQVVPQTGAGQTKETAHLTLEADDRLCPLFERWLQRVLRVGNRAALGVVDVEGENGG